VRIAARRLGERLHLTVENQMDPEAAVRPGEGVGLANVRGRLAALYGQNASVEVRQDGGIFRVELAWPAVPASAQ
jgi:LytS/YehU family sensor histidine kinase